VFTRHFMRKSMNQKRNQLSLADRDKASTEACQLLLTSPYYQVSEHIAVYFAYQGEIDPDLMLKTAIAEGKQIYLPVLDPVNQQNLLFIRYELNMRLVRNQFNILEPMITANNIIALKQLDLVVMPLVAFDDHGNRLGMGVGYYDRTFAYLKINPKQRPILLGIGYEFQRVEKIKAEKWDVPLNAVVTELKAYKFG
jgi:5-formyltetrahydrofolate cyclo-ligase